MIRRSLLLRLLGLSLAVAVLAVAATAWLTTQETGERFRGEFERTLEADTFIYQELNAFALDHESWEGVEPLVNRLAEQSGRRVALTSQDGSVLADSANHAGAGSSLPSTPTAEINPLSASLTSAVATDTATASSQFLGDVGAVPDDTVPRGGGLSISASMGVAGPIPAVSPAWRLTDTEVAKRVELASEATTCLREELGVDAEVVVGPGGDLVMFDASDGELIAEQDADHIERSGGDDVEARGFTASGELPDVDECVPEELAEPSEAAVELNRREIELLEHCLDEADVPYTMVAGRAGLRRAVLDSASEASDSANTQDQADSAAWNACAAEAHTEAMSGFVADPALLFTGNTDRFDPFGSGWWRTMTVTLAVLIVATGVTVLAGRRLTRPIRALTAAAGRMGSGDHTARVAIRGRDEVGQLAQAFNSMAESIQANDAQRRAMVSDIAHELRTPLANVRGYLEAAEDGVVPLDPALVTSLLEESTLLQRLIDDLQELALADAGMLRIHPEPRDAADLAQQVVAAHQTGADEAGIELRVDMGDADGDGDGPGPDASTGLNVHVDPERIRQALGNLVTNAIRFTPSGGDVSVSVRRDGSSVLLAVQDDGPGISAEHLPRLFDRFYRVEGSRSRETGGSGLGLAIAKHLVEAHDGSIEVSSTEGAGSVFTIRLPVHEVEEADRPRGQGARSL